MKHKAIDVDYIETNDGQKKYYTIDEVSQKIQVDVATIIFWCNKFNELLKIESVGMYKIFDDNDISNLKTIKRLNIYEKMNVSDIREYFKKHTEVLIRKEKSQVDISIFNVFANIITAQNDKLSEINNNYNEMIKKQDKALELFLKVHEEISLDRDQQKEYIKELENKVTELSDLITEQRDETINKINEVIASKIDEIEAKAIERDNQISNFFKERQEQHKLEMESTQQDQKKKSLFSRFFK